MPTIYEIAKQAGVSPGTVSKVFNNYKRINQETREKVFRVAKEMGYRPNPTAASLKTRQSYIVGVIFSEDVGIGIDHPFFSKILEHFRHFMGEKGYDTVFINKSLGGSEIGYLEHCRHRNVDGALVITASPGDNDMIALFNSDIKCITTDMVVESVPFVMSDNIEGARMAVHYLYQLGHRKIGHIAGDLSTISAGERHLGYEKGLQEIGIPFEEKLVIESGWLNPEQAYDATLRYIDRFTTAEMPTALFVSSDIMAVMAMNALNSRGIRVPEDVSIIGFDDVDVCKLVRPRLTTVKQDKKQIAKSIADTLYNCIQGSEINEMVKRIPVEIVIRESVKDLNV